MFELLGSYTGIKLGNWSKEKELVILNIRHIKLDHLYLKYTVVLRHEGSRIDGGWFLKVSLGGSGAVPDTGSHRPLTASGLVFIQRRPQPHRVL